MNMRIFVTALMLAVALASSAFAGNVALSGLGASATCGGTPSCTLGSFVASNTIDGSLATEWVAPGGTVGPYVLVDLGQLYTIDSVTISGVGNSGYSIGFEVFVGTSSNVATLEGGTPITGGSPIVQSGGAAWNDTYSVSIASPIRYVLYDVTTSNNSDHPTYDDAYTTEIAADSVPEPGTIGLIGTGLLALGFSLRRKK
jgi:hypothetical protein